MAYLHTPVLLLALSAAVFFVVRALLPKRLPKGTRRPPGPKGWPLIGNAAEFADGQLIPVFNRYAKQYGPIVQFNLLGERQVVLSDEKSVHDLFVTRGSIYSDRGIPHAMAYVSKNMSPALMPKNESWRRQRKLMHEAIGITSNEKYLGFMNDEATLALADLIEQPSDYKNHFIRYSYSVLTRSILGFRTKSANDDFVIAKEDYVNDVMKCFRPDEYPSNIFWPLRYLPAWTMNSLAKMQQLLDLDAKDRWGTHKAIQKQVDNGTALDSLYARFFQNRDQYDISDEEATYAFQAMIGAGTRSPTNALLNYLILCMKYPEWQTKLQEEVDRVAGPNRLPNFDDLPQLPIVRAFVKEGIRYRSIVAELGIPHRLEKDDIYEGLFFEEGTIFHANFAAILMDKEKYPDQKLFNPDRWLSPEYPTYREPLTQYPNCQNFLAFGSGRRACPGYDFAERTMYIMVAKMAWACTVVRPLDPATKKPVELDIKYEPTPNPPPYPFPCEIVIREGRGEIVRKEAAKVDAAESVKVEVGT